MKINSVKWKKNLLIFAMRSKTILSILIAALLLSLFSAGCMTDDAPSHQIEPYILPSNGVFLHLPDLWERIVETTGIDDRTAILDQCRITLDPKGSVESIQVDFSAESSGGYSFYQIRYLPGELSLWQPDYEPPGLSGEHPIRFLRAIQDLPFDLITMGEGGLVILAESQSGSLRYDAATSDLFLLEEGTLIPLKEAFFSTEIPWYTIHIEQRDLIDPVLTNDGTSGVVSRVITPEPAGMRSTFTVFLPEELEKAEEYLLMEGF